MISPNTLLWSDENSQLCGVRRCHPERIELQQPDERRDSDSYIADNANQPAIADEPAEDESDLDSQPDNRSSPW